MQPGVKLVMATVWLTAVVGATTLPSNPFDDQYSPLPPQHPVHQDQEALENWQKGQKFLGDRSERPIEVPKTAEDESPGDWTVSEERVDEGSRTLKSVENGEATASEDESFVADDNFQDQGPGSVEVYKLDLHREKSLLGSAGGIKNLPRMKSKVPKKASMANRISWKPKAIESKVSDPKVPRESLDEDQPSEKLKKEVFGVGGVPELQVGCEGLEASHRSKRSLDPKSDLDDFDPSLHVTPLTIDLDYEEGESDEEKDELLKLRKMATTTPKPAHLKNRGDIEAPLKLPVDLENILKTQKLPVRGDLGDSSPRSRRSPETDKVEIEVDATTETDSSTSNEFPQGVEDEDSSDEAEELADKWWMDHFLKSSSNFGRRLFGWGWEEEEEDESLKRTNEGEREKRDIWGFGENEGLVSSDELQSEERRRQREEEERRREEEIRRGRGRGGTTEGGPSRSEQEMEWRRREHQRRLEEARRPDDQDRENKRRIHEERLRAEERRRSEEEGRKKQEENQRVENERRRQWLTRWREEEERRRLEDQRRNNQPVNLIRQESQRGSDDTRHTQEEEAERREREEKLREYLRRNRPIEVNPRLEEARRGRTGERKLPEWRANATRAEEERRREEEHRRREEEYRKRWEEERRQAEERKLQDYVRRNQPVTVAPRREPDRREEEERRRIFEAARRYDRMRNPMVEIGGRSRGPSPGAGPAPTGSVEEARRRQEATKLQEERRKQEEDYMKREAARREDERRREESRRYEEDRKRQEAARREDERRRKEQIEEQRRRLQAGRTWTVQGREDRRRIEDEGRRKQVLEAANLWDQRRREEQERRRQRERIDERRLKEQKQREEERTNLSEQRRKWEETRLNSLPVSARIIVRSGDSVVSPVPTILSRSGGDNEIGFPGFSPEREGPQAARFPAPATVRPPVRSPAPCVWAVVQCCPYNSRMTACFESLGCPGVNWDPNPCRRSLAQSAQSEIRGFYATASNNDPRH